MPSKPQLLCKYQTRPGRCSRPSIVKKYAVRKTGKSVQVGKEFCKKCNKFISALKTKRGQKFEFPEPDRFSAFRPGVMVYCPEFGDVSPQGCINAYTDVAAFQKTWAPCFRCRYGKRRRTVFADIGPENVMSLEKELRPAAKMPTIENK